MKINETYDQWSSQYDHNRNATRDLDHHASQAVLAPYELGSVLELGCGTGKNTAWMHLRAEYLVGVDFSIEMLKIARQKIDSEKVRFVQADLTMPWQFGISKVDLITCNLVLEHIEDLGHIFKMAHRSLKANGLFFISELHPLKLAVGSGARFEQDGKLVEVPSFAHSVADFSEAAMLNDFDLVKTQDWYDEPPRELPRLITFIFRKRDEK